MGLKNLIGQGANYTPAYQASGTPYVTSSAATGKNEGPQVVNFPYVTKNITIRNLGGVDLRVAFTLSGSYKVGEAVGGGAVKVGTDPRATAYQGNNYFTLPAESADAAPSQVMLDARCKQIFLMADHATTNTGYSLYAGLTGISTDQFPVLSASNGFLGVG